MKSMAESLKPTEGQLLFFIIKHLRVYFYYSEPEYFIPFIGLRTIYDQARG